MILRPYGVVIDGHLEIGLELVLDSGRIREVRPHTGIPENFIVSPAFVNAHSHLEYRGMMGKMQSTEYWPWIRELTELKKSEADVRVRQECIAAAHENRKTGVALIAEHSDRPHAATAMTSAGIKGVIFQETITFLEGSSRLAKISRVREKALSQTKVWRQPVFLTPHAYFTVDKETLTEFGASGEPISIHVAETAFESQYTRFGEGYIADFRRQAGYTVEPTGKSIVGSLADLGLVRPGAQFVHCCDVDGQDLTLMARNQVSVAHCPRSNVHLKCPPAPVREMLDTGISVGLGLDSPASSGPIDMFDEMRSAIHVSCERGKPLRPEEVWNLATTWGANSLRFALPDLTSWRIEPGSSVPLIKIMIPAAGSVEELIERGSPGKVGWV